ncbi:MAG: hypothetical protein D6691_08680 [Candidatus Hydrogenedentota bacterium]|uniref:Cell division protein FtsQ n=1 Tax=Sumerlaea chitinivorans TaxID=2250252 RepID=A0A2Z4Y5X3_SUMC1|nr:Cell division protein FtsQ [Candidatus Sumerlaea chitinivorans]RMH25972.1 MAG: hypothetical protein D6691_08680 [Candidatus Hydrogenedentota bacterium]
MAYLAPKSKREVVRDVTSGRRAPKSRDHRGRRRRSPLLFLFYLIGTSLAVWAIAQASYQWVLDQPYFRLRTLKIVGVSKPLEDELRSLTSELLGPNPNLLAINLTKLQRDLAAYPKIRQPRVSISYPDTLLVSAAERVPVAIVSADGFYLVDREGYVVDRVRPAALREYDLPYITGIAGSEVEVGKQIPNVVLRRALELVETLRDRNPELYSWLSEVNLAKDPVAQFDNITARLRGGMEVRFGDKNPVEKLPALDFFVQQQKQQGNDPFSLAYVDLRFRNQIVYMDRATALALRAGLLEDIEATAKESEAAEKKKDSHADKTASNARSASFGGPASENQNPQTKRKSESVRSENRSRQAGNVEDGTIEFSHEPSVVSDLQPEVPQRRSRFFFWRRQASQTRQPILLAPVDDQSE